MVVRMTVAMTMIGPPHRGKPRHDLPDIGSQFAQHVLDNVVPLDQDAIVIDLGRQMPISQMPGKNRQRQTAAGTHFQQRFFGSHNFDLATVFENQTITMRKRSGRGKIHQNSFAARQRQHLAPQMALVVRHDERTVWHRVLVLSDFSGANEIFGHAASQNRK